jgi:hypothetical protein
MNVVSSPGANALPDAERHLCAHSAPFAPDAIAARTNTLPASKRSAKGLEFSDFDTPPERSTQRAEPTDTCAAKMGETGKEAAMVPSVTPPFPVLPVSAPVTAEASPHIKVTLPENDDVFTPAPRGNPVVRALKDASLYRSPGTPGQHVVTCLWASEHEQDQPDEAIYFEPTSSRPLGAYVCAQTHMEEPRMDRVFSRLSVEESAARCKSRIRLVPGEGVRIIDRAERALVSQSRFYQSGGAIVTVRVTPAGEATAVPVTEQTIIRALSVASDWEKFDGSAKVWRRCDPPSQIARQLLGSQVYDHLPTLDHIARQPFFRQADSVLVTEPGYDTKSRTYGAFQGKTFPPVPSSPEAAFAALSELKELLAEFHFASPADGAAALCGIVTAAARSSLPLSPAFNVTASTPGSGKSYIASLLAAFASPGEPLNMSYPTSADEATKAMLAALTGKPAMILFDDMQTDWLPHGTMNRILTSETVADRVLGSNNTRQVSTRTFVMGTGNNVGPVRDMCRRVVTITLWPETGTPATLSYRRKPVEEVKADRERFVSLALTIPSAWRAAGCPKADVPSIATFGAWSDTCRQSLIWLGEPDPATSLIQQVQNDPDGELFGRMMLAWHAHFGSKATTVRKVIERAATDSTLQDAIIELPVADRNVITPKKFGWFLRKNENHIVNGMYVRKEPCSERTAWSVQLTHPSRKVEPEVIRLPDGSEMVDGEIY